MNNKIYSLFNNLENDFCQICSEVETFMGSTLEWADELIETVEKEFTTSKESPSFQLPKTPSEKKTRNRKARNALVSKCSVLNSTVEYNGVPNLNETVTTRTRAARRAVTSKISQLNITKEPVVVDIKNETRTVDKDAAEVTFVVPQSTSTRTKPVLRNKNQELPVIAPPSPAPRQSRSKVSRAHSESPIERRSRRKISRTLSGSPVDVQSKRKVLKDVSQDENVKNHVPETPISNSNKESDSKKTLRTPSGSPPERQSRHKISRVISSPEQNVGRKLSRTLSGSPFRRKSNRNLTRTHSRSPALRQCSVRMSRTLSENLVVRYSNSDPATPVPDPLLQPNILKVIRTSSNSPVRRSGRTTSLIQNNASEIVEKERNEADFTVTIKREPVSNVASTFIITHTEKSSENNVEEFDENELTPRVRDGRFTRISKTSTPMVCKEKLPIINVQKTSPDTISDEVTNSNINSNATYSVAEDTVTLAEESDENPHPKKKRKLKKEDETLKENIEEMVETVRITRTKSKAIKQMMEENENKQADLAQFAKKLLNRAKMTSLKKNQLATLLENNISTPKNGPGANLPFGNLTTKSKYHLLLTNSKIKTPLATLPNSAVKIPKPIKSGDKSKAAKQDMSAEKTLRSVTKPTKDASLEKEKKLKSKKDKEEEAAMKREKVIKTKQEELKRKNELKHQLAMKQREKLEQEKYNNMIQSEKEKEERHKIILQERQMKLKEEAIKKKMMTQQKIAETNERRRLEEEARIAKLKEMEAEEQRLALEKQREQEKQEKRALERLAQKKAREEYELQLKQELEAERLKAEKMSTTKKFLMSASKMQSASKRQKFGLLGEKKEWDYKPRNENDYGLDDEHSEVDSEDEGTYDKSKQPVPWAKKIMAGKGPYVKILTLEMMCEYMPCYRKSPDINKMFKMTPTKRIKRTSSAIWNTPSS